MSSPHGPLVTLKHPGIQKELCTDRYHGASGRTYHTEEGIWAPKPNCLPLGTDQTWDKLSFEGQRTDHDPYTLNPKHLNPDGTMSLLKKGHP